MQCNTITVLSIAAMNYITQHHDPYLSCMLCNSEPLVTATTSYLLYITNQLIVFFHCYALTTDK